MLNTFEVNKVLIIAPLRVARDTWPAEIEKWDHLKNLDISIVVGDVKTRIAAVHHPAMRSLNDILADCRVAFSGLTESEKAANAESLVGKNAMSGFLALMNSGEGDINKLRGAIENCDGSAESMAETMQDNLNGQLTILKSQLEELAISFGDLLMPTIRKIVSAVQAFVDKLNSMDDSTRETILKVAALAAAIGPLLIVLGKTISTVGTALRGFSSLAKGIRLLSTRVGGATGLFGKLGAALGGISAPVMAVVRSVLSPESWTSSAP